MSWLHTCCCCWWCCRTCYRAGGVWNYRGNCCCDDDLYLTGVYSSSSSTLCVWHVVKNICLPRSQHNNFRIVEVSSLSCFGLSPLSRGLRSDNHQIFALILQCPTSGPPVPGVGRPNSQRDIRAHLFPIDTQEKTTNSLSNQRRTRVIPSPPPCIEICTFWMNYWPKLCRVLKETDFLNGKFKFPICLFFFTLARSLGTG